MNHPRRALTAVLTAVLLSVPTSPALLPAATAAPATQQTRAATAAPVEHRAPSTATVTFRTVPAVPGVRIGFGDRTLVTDARGRATYTAPESPARPTLRLLDTAVDTPDRRYRFVRWTGQRDPDQAFRPVVHGLPLRGDYTVTAGFQVRYPVTPRFTDQHGRPLDTDRISAVRVKGSDGHQVRLDPTGTSWLDGGTPVHRGSGLELSPVTYSLQSLVYDRAQLVDAGRQRFRPDAGRVVTFTGLFHDLTITAHDTVFNRPAGSEARVTGPDGTQLRVPLGSDHSAVLRHLPRGRYSVNIHTPGGSSATHELQLSRSTALDVQVLSGLDTLTLAGGLLVVIVVPLVVHLRRRRRPTAAKAGSR
ncbi:hypothetical protein [Streptomyces sp. T028]|uniref:hypothetical protein n=1 Tax=Streptomyces sp. T028 TaxID=3394379 RepID=UPI003A8395F2